MVILGIDASRANKPRKSGTEVYAWELIRNLQKFVPPEVEVLLYTREKLEATIRPTAVNWKEKILSWPPRFFWTLIRMSAEMFRRQPDVLWIPTHTIPFFAPRTVVTIHDVGFLARPKLYKLSDRIYHLFSTRRIIKHAEHIITVSEFSKREIMKFCNLPSERISVTPLAASANYVPVPSEKRKKVLENYGISEPYFIFVGRFEKKKNIDGLLDSFRILRRERKNIKLVLVGRAGYGGERAIHAGSDPRRGVQIIGWARQEDMPALISGALALILPSHYEGFGLPALEAMATGTPVICSGNASFREVGGDAAIYINTLNLEDLAKAMTRIYKEPEFRAGVVRKGLERSKLFSWEKTAEATWNVLERYL